MRGLGPDRQRPAASGLGSARCDHVRFRPTRAAVLHAGFAPGPLVGIRARSGEGGRHRRHRRAGVDIGLVGRRQAATATAATCTVAFGQIAGRPLGALGEPLGRVRALERAGELPDELLVLERGVVWRQSRSTTCRSCAGGNRPIRGGSGSSCAGQQQQSRSSGGEVHDGW